MTPVQATKLPLFEDYLKALLPDWRRVYPRIEDRGWSWCLGMVASERPSWISAAKPRPFQGRASLAAVLAAAGAVGANSAQRMRQCAAGRTLADKRARSHGDVFAFHWLERAFVARATDSEGRRALDVRELPSASVPHVASMDRGTMLGAWSAATRADPASRRAAPLPNMGGAGSASDGALPLRCLSTFGEDFAEAALLVAGDTWLRSLAEAVNLIGGCAHPDWLLQAFASAPFLLAAVRDGNGGAEGHMNAQTVVDLVDAGHPPRAVVARLIGPLLGRPPCAGLVEATLNLRVPRPGTAFARFLDDALREGARGRKFTAKDAVSLLALADRAVPRTSGERTFPAAGARRALAAHTGPSGAIVPPMEDLNELVEWVAALARYAGAPWPAAAVATVLYPEGRTPSSLRRLRDTWRRDGRHATAVPRVRTAARAAAGVEALFPGLVGFPVPMGMAVRQLLSEGDCAAEGHSMSHCAGARADSAAAGHSLVFSVVDVAGRSTVEFVVRRTHLEVAEAKSAGNAPAPEGHVAWAGEVASWFARRTDPAAVDAFLDARRRASATPDVDQLLASLKADDREAVADIAFDALKPFLSPSARRGGRRAWLARLASSGSADPLHGESA